MQISLESIYAEMSLQYLFLATGVHLSFQKGINASLLTVHVHPNQQVRNS